MKKAFLLGAAALFSLAFVVTSCSDDEDETCVDCTDGTDTWELCWEEGNNIDKIAKAFDFAMDHPNAICEEE